ncbi:MAG: hypothetical protein COX79_05730 [Candidatus Levybacteria bacterium CG_4_10_14_0_2_um_filter_36_16]|nr:MAG: hypothetical protein AUK12_01260 [Candidatus Levybacteria bacterium CG2_30_37_29]PIZ96170.1 MAG: hypothetical protein COX79_05730 [Candidatus Levybacteria bacterium CG_4_10_14_0_2_um_filter_36_16]
MENSLSFISLGGVGDVTKNLYLYEIGGEILVVDCGIGFAEETMPGVDLMIPDISYLKNILRLGPQNSQQTGKAKKIVGMFLTHGHEDHIGALPFILPNLPNFPIYASNLTAALANEKLKDFGLPHRVTTASFDQTITLGAFRVSLARVTHSIIDAANLFIRTPVGNFYHASDFKFDFTPVDGKPSEIRKIAKFGEEGVLCLMSDSLGAERPGHSKSELSITESFDDEFRKAKGKVFVSTYSSNISRMNQAIEVALKYNRKVCFIGRSFLKARDVGKQLGYMSLPTKMDIKPQDAKRLPPNQVMILVAGSQAQVESALVRIASDNDKDLRITRGDTIIFSADPIPGNEVNINSLIDTLSKKEARVVYSDISDHFHVSGHGSQNDLKLMISLTNPKFVLPIGGTYRQMVAYREIARDMGYRDDKIILLDQKKEIIFSEGGFRFGKIIDASKIYVDQITGEKIESFVVMDRKKIAEEGIVVVIVEVNSQGQLVSRPDIITKGIIYQKKEQLAVSIEQELKKMFGRSTDNNVNLAYVRKTIQQTTEGIFYREKREPLVIPVVLEI